MKRIPLMALILVLAVSPAGAAAKHREAPRHRPEAKSAPSESSWEVGIGPLLTTPMHDINSNYNAGFGGLAYLGYALNRDFRVQLNLDNVVYSKNSLSDYELRAVPSLKYLIGGGELRPYLMAGMGVDVQFAAVPGQSATGISMAETVGIGFQYRLADLTNLFVEGKYNFTFSTGVVGEDLPVVAGLEFGI